MIRKVDHGEPFKPTPAARGPSRAQLATADLAKAEGKNALAPNWKAAEKASQSLKGRVSLNLPKKSTSKTDLAALKGMKDLSRRG